MPPAQTATWLGARQLGSEAAAREAGESARGRGRGLEEIGGDEIGGQTDEGSKGADARGRWWVEVGWGGRKKGQAEKQWAGGWEPIGRRLKDDDRR